MEQLLRATMLATIAGFLALLLGVLLLVLPLLATELSRPGDSAWGAVVLLLGLVLVTSADRLSGAPMLAVGSGGLLVGRLMREVGQARWLQLTPEERQRLGSAERWQTSLSQLAATLAGLLQVVLGRAREVGASLAKSRPRPSSGKRWVRPESVQSAAAPEAAAAAPQPRHAAAEALAAPAPLVPGDRAPEDSAPDHSASGGPAPVDPATDDPAAADPRPVLVAAGAVEGVAAEAVPADVLPPEVLPPEVEAASPGPEDVVWVASFAAIEDLLVAAEAGVAPAAAGFDAPASADRAAPLPAEEVAATGAAQHPRPPGTG